MSSEVPVETAAAAPVASPMPEVVEIDTKPETTIRRRSKSKTVSPLTKSGKERKAHVMTEARKLAFEKCVAARKQQLQLRKSSTSVA